MAHAHVGAHAHHAVAQARDPKKLEKLARLGMLTKGTLYAVTGVLAFRAAFGNGSSVGSKGALMEIASKPMGTALLVLMAIGLFAYALFSFAQAAFDLDGVGRDAKGMLQRAGQVGSGIIHATLGAWAISVLVGSRGTGNSQQTWLARLLQYDWGPWVVGLFAAGAFGIAVSQFIRAYRHTFMRQLKREEMNSKEIRTVRRAGEVGFAARGIVFAMIGWFYTQAAMQSDPSEAGGLNKALQTLHQQPWGGWLLAAMSLALLAYAVYCGFAARYRTVRYAHGH